MTGISQSTISDWKHKKTNPAVDKIMIICDVLNVSPYDLLSGTENKNYRQLEYIMVDKATEDYTLLNEFRNLNPSDKDRLLGYLQALKDNN